MDFRLPPDWELTPVTLAQAESYDWSLRQSGIPELWSRTKGDGITVAVLDTGVDSAHPDLAGAIADSKDFTRSFYGPEDRQGHGTWCVGHIAARLDLKGMAGIAPECKILSGKVLGDNGSGSENSILAGFKWAMDSGADIISMSLGGSSLSKRFGDMILEFVQQPGKYVIAAAGNSGPGTPVLYPAAWPTTICVAAMDQDGKLTNFSSRGPEVDIVAPGYEMVSLAPGGRYATMSGTSMATPHVAGVVALMLAADETDDWKTDDLRRVLGSVAHKKTPEGFPILDPRGILDEIKDGPSDNCPVHVLRSAPIVHEGRSGVFVWME